MQKICPKCGIEFIPFGNPHRTIYCSLRCQESAARSRKRERDKVRGRPDLPHLAYRPGGMEDYYTPPTELHARLSPEMRERIARGEPAVREVFTDFHGNELSPTFTEDAITQAMKLGGDEKSTSTPAEKPTLRVLTPEEKEAAIKKYLEKERGNLKIIETTEDARFSSGIRVVKPLEKEPDRDSLSDPDHEPGD